jgi:hypothetical protein
MPLRVSQKVHAKSALGTTPKVRLHGDAFDNQRMRII